MDKSLAEVRLTEFSVLAGTKQVQTEGAHKCVDIFAI
jgi:hypothetical protein